MGYSELQWQKNYELAKNYYAHYKNLNIPLKFKTKDGINYSDDGVNLGFWLNSQKIAYREGKLKEKRKELLEQIGIEFNLHDVKFNVRYELAKNYYEHYGNLKITKKFKTVNGIDYDEGGIRLDSWLNHQKDLYKDGKLKEERKILLEQIGLDFDEKENKFYKKYELAKTYYEYYGNLDIPEKFKTKNGIEYDEEGISLGVWIVMLKILNKEGNLPEDKKILLEQIGLVFNKREKNFQMRYEMAKTYYEHYGNLAIPYNFKTKNGIDYDEDGTSLGTWINAQRKFYNEDRLSQEKIDKFNLIGIYWNSMKKQENINDLCIKYGIDLKLNKDVLDHISYDELNAKIKYLLSQNIAITNNGFLHEIFSMSNLNMKVKYKVDIEELIDRFCIITNVKKRKKDDNHDKNR